jgi:hypothetical protein
MWVKFEAISSDNDIICFPYSWSEITSKIETAVFGSCDPVSVNVIYSDSHEPDADNTCEHPGTIGISSHLCKQLLLPTSLVYQMKIDDSRIIIGPVIGLLLGIHSHRYNPKHMKKYSDRMGIYSQIGGLIYAFSPKTVNWEKHQAFGLFYNIASEEWEYGCFPLPEVIYRRDFHSNPKYIKRLSEITGGRLFNSYRFTKMELYDYLNTQKDMKKYLPPTELSLSYEQVSKFIGRYRKVILKPLDLSRGRGICIIEKYDAFYRITDYRRRYPTASTLKGPRDLEQFFKLNPGFFHKYLIQQYLNLARIGSSVFDIRVVMQKHKSRV